MCALLAAVVAVFIGLLRGSGSRLRNPAPAWIVAAAGAELVSIASYAALFWGSSGDESGGRPFAASPPGCASFPGRCAARGPCWAQSAIGPANCAVLILAFHAVHASVPIDVVVPAYMLGQLGNTLPLPGGVGGVEPIMLGILTASGVNAGLAGAAIILYRLISIGLQTLLGGLASATLIRSLGPGGTGAVTPVLG